LRWVDPSEPLFEQDGSHPVVVYRQVSVMIGRPYWIGDRQQQAYQGNRAKSCVSELTDWCHGEIATWIA